MRAVAAMLVIGVLVGLSSAAEPDAATIVTATGIRSGLAVTVPAADGRLESELAAGARMLVHSLALDAAAVDRARSAIAGAKLTGVATVEQTTTLPSLPYIDRGVNLLVVHLDALGAKAPGADELLRVLAPTPNGAAYVKTGGKWEVRRKPLPKTARGWTTSGAESASGSYVNDDYLSGLPNTLQWANPPVGGAKSSSFMIIAEGYAFWCEGATRSYRAGKGPGELRVWCADAFSGVVRWKLDVNEEVIAVADGLLITDELESGLSRTRNAATGELIVEHTNGLRSPRNNRGLTKDKNHTAMSLGALTEGWMKISDGVVVQNYNRDLVALDARTGKVLWKKTVADGRFDKTAIDQGVVIALVTQDKKSNGMKYMWGLRTVAYELRTGKELWSNSAVADRPIDSFMARHGIVFASSDISPPDKGFFDQPITYFNHMTVINTADGRTAWQRKEGPLDAAAKALADPASGRSVAKGWDNTFGRNGIGHGVVMEMGRNGAVAFSAKDGSPQWLSAANGSTATCQVPTACATHFIGHYMNISALPGATGSSWFPISRAGCFSTYRPAFGMLFSTPPNPDFSSNWSLGGYAAFSYQPLPALRTSEQRFEKGSDSPAAPAATAGWSNLMGDSMRSSSTPDPGPETLKVAWTAKLATAIREAPVGPVTIMWTAADRSPRGLTPPVADNNVVVVADSGGHRVVALQPAGGKLLWEYRAAGRIAPSPALAGALCLVPSADGWVTALNAANGKMVWRFNVNVYGRKGVFQGQVEAALPPTGGVLVHNGTVYITGGRHTGLEGGCTLYGLQLATGKVVFEQKLDAEHVVVGYGNLQGVSTAAVALDLLQTDMSGRYLIGEGFAVDTTKNEVAKLPTYGIKKTPGPLRTGMFRSGPKPLLFWEALIPCGGSRNGSYGKLVFPRFDTRDESRDFTYPGGGGREKPLGSFIVIHQNRLFVLKGGGKRGGACQIDCWPLNASYEVPEKPAWSVPYIKTFAGAAISGKDSSPRLAAFIAAGNRLYLAGYDVDGRPFLDQINAGTGDGIGGISLAPDRAVTRHGLAVVQNRLYASCVGGHLLCIE